MASENVVTITDTNFQEEVIGSDKPVLVDFWAEWCPPCLRLAPTIDKLADDYAGKFKIGKLNTEDSRETAMQFDIKSIPTMLIFKGGELVKTIVGIRREEELVEELDAVLAD